MKPSINVDIEPTNRCNAKCYFCPRDQTPHQGLMSPETFDLALARVSEYRSTLNSAFETADIEVSLCGLGEPLLNPKTPSFVRKVRDAGFPCSMSSNAAILDERRGRAVLDAGLQRVFLNVGEKDEAYDDIYELPFEKTRDHVVQFLEMAGDECRVVIVLVDHRRDAEHLAEMKQYWEGLGITDFVQYDVMNRGGALFVDHMQYETYPELAEAQRLLNSAGQQALCVVPFIQLFVGYDGKYYLCCSDWRKEASFGHVRDESFVSIIQAKLDYVTTRGSVCRTCNLDPVNTITEELREVAAGRKDRGEVEALIDAMNSTSERLVDSLGRIRATAPGEAAKRSVPPRRLIPVRAE